jgi:uncharacterized protein YndB with AHSA1/START domain
MAEVTIEDEVFVKAPIADVWAAIEDRTRHAEWHPFVTRIEGEHAPGATRVCHVRMGKKEGETRERCTESTDRERITWLIEADTSGFLRLVSDWSAGFHLEERDGGVVVRARSAFRPKNAAVRLLLPLVRRKFHQAQDAILAALKRFAEA